MYSQAPAYTYTHERPRRTFDGKQMRKAVERKCYDFNTSLFLHLEVRSFWL